MKKLIKVTQDNINNAKVNLTDCPVALALKDAGFNNPIVDCTGFRAKGFRGDFPDKANDFTRLFDARKPVEPFWFELEYTNVA